MAIEYKNIPLRDKKIKFTIQLEDINGITGNNRFDILDFLLFKRREGEIFYNKEKIKPEEKKKFVSYVEEFAFSKYFQNKVIEAMYYELRRKGIDLKDPKKKILESLKIVGLPSSILERNLKFLSSSEKALLRISIGLLSNPEILIIEEPFEEIDKQNLQKVLLLFRRMTDQYNKTIIIISNDMDSIYQYTDHCIILQENKVVLEGYTREVLRKSDVLKKNGMKVPEMIEFTELANKKEKGKIDYHRDIRDIIKDIYKHV